MCGGTVPCQHAARHSTEQMIYLVSRMQERKIQEDARYKKRCLNHIFRHVAIMGGQSNVAGNYEEEMRRYNETEAGFFLYLLRSKFQLLQSMWEVCNNNLYSTLNLLHFNINTFVSCRKANCIRQKADAIHGYPMSHIIDPMILGIVSLRLYGSMNRHAARDAPSKHRNILIVDMNGRLDMRDLYKKRQSKGKCKCSLMSSISVYGRTLNLE